MKINGLPVNFTLSLRAKEMIEELRLDWNRRFSDPAGVASIAWGIMTDERTGKSAGLPMVSFYAQSQMPEIVKGIETVSGIDVVFFITSEDYWRFRDKVLDFDPKKGFVLV